VAREKPKNIASELTALQNEPALRKISSPEIGIFNAKVNLAAISPHSKLIVGI
jgi:hypothetical protein